MTNVVSLEPLGHFIIVPEWLGAAHEWWLAVTLGNVMSHLSHLVLNQIQVQFSTSNLKRNVAKAVPEKANGVQP